MLSAVHHMIPLFLTQGHSPEFASAAVGEETGLRTPRFEPVYRPAVKFQAGPLWQVLRFIMFSFFHEEKPQFGKGTVQSCNISLESCSTHFKDIG